MLVVLKDDQWLYLDQVFPHEDEIFWKEFSVCDPKKVQFVDSAQYGWDGVTRFYNRAKQRLPRPFLAKLKKVCRENGIPYDIVDERQPSKIKMLTAEDVTPDFLPGIIIEDYQIRGIQAMIRSEVGILAYPTGSGKTEIMAGGVKAIEEGNIVILANQKVVLDQIKSRLSLRDVDDGEGIGLFYAGKKPNGESIVVGSVDSLIPPTKRPEPPVRKAGEKDGEFRRRQKAFEQRDKGFQTRLRNAKMLQKYVKNADVLMIDECDLAASKKYKKIFQFLFRGRRRFGFSGTPFDPSKPVQNMIVQSHLGGVIAQETLERVEQLDRVVPIEFTMFLIDGDPAEASAYDIAVTERMVECTGFHRLITRLCGTFPDEDGTLILVDKELLGKNIESAMAAAGIESSFIYGKTSKKRRDVELTRFEAREFNVLIGGKILDRGLDLKGGCENLIITTGGMMQSGFIQKLGRAVRKNRRGVGRVYDFFHRTNRTLYKHSRARLKMVVELGYKTTVIYPGGRIDGAEFVRRRFQLPKRKPTPLLK